MWLVVVLVSILSLSLGYKVDSGCEDWVPSTLSHVCCQRCKPGNMLVTKCGPNPETLCKPCTNGTYVVDYLSTFCHRCQECRDTMILKEACTPSHDTVCTCGPGFLCGDIDCSFCILECGKGQEPTADRGCRPCPAGTYNDKIHQPCIQWSSGCMLPNLQVVANGTAFSDIVCDSVDEPTNSPGYYPTKSKEPCIANGNACGPVEGAVDSPDPWVALVIAAVCAALVVCLVFYTLVVNAYKKCETVEKSPEPENALAERMLAQESEQCSYCFPQQEHGSSSQASLVSDDKPFELVV